MKGAIRSHHTRSYTHGPYSLYSNSNTCTLLGRPPRERLPNPQPQRGDRVMVHESRPSPSAHIRSTSHHKMSRPSLPHALPHTVNQMTRLRLNRRHTTPPDPPTHKPYSLRGTRPSEAACRHLALLRCTPLPLLVCGCRRLTGWSLSDLSARVYSDCLALGKRKWAVRD